MFPLVGNSHMENSDYEATILSFRACTSSNTTPHEWIALGGLTGKLPNNWTSKLFTFFDRYPDGNLMISTPRYHNICMTPCMRRVAQKMPSTISIR